VREIDSAWASIAMGTEAGLVPRRVARGSRCFGVWRGHELVGYGWLSAKSEWIGEVELEISPPDREAYIWNCVTLDKHRRKGVFRTLVKSVVAKTREEGLAKIWIASETDLAENAIEQAGFVRVVLMNTGSRFGMRWLSVTPARGVDSGLLQAAREAMTIKPGMSIRRSKKRTH
jgi:GNAT superfamily N-acetyltransferase